MRKLALLTFLAVTAALPLQAARGREQSYISYDDGGTLLRQAEDGRDIEARVNMPLFIGDELITNRRGRAEVRLADGNIVGVDRASAVKLLSVLNDFDSESASGTIIELHYGKLAVYRTADTNQSLRLDTMSASYFVNREAIFSVETDSKGPDRVSIFSGTVDVRTPARTVRLREGQAARVDTRGPFELVADNTTSADDFERWFLKRVDRFADRDSRYLDASLAPYDADLSANGTWTFIAGYGWGWRPYVAAGWRPYYYGQWVHSPGGTLVWVSYEPWGWAPYHYGRWAYDAMYGWFWLPGYTYSPAWVYWWYGPSYVGWAPAGFWDCHRGYYDWAYRPYQHADFGFGFYGRVHVNEVDLRPWTFVDSRTIISNRVDRAALSTDVVRGRLIREPGGFGVVSGTPARFGKSELKDPAAAVNTIYRRGLVGGGPNGTPIADVTPFIRRDADPTGAIRDRMLRTRPVEGGVGVAGRVPASGASPASGSLAPIGGGSVAPIAGGSLAPIGGGSVAPTGGGSVAPIGGGTLNRGGQAPPASAVPGETRTGGSSGRIGRGEAPRNEAPFAPGPATRDGGSSPGGQIERGAAPRESGSGAVNRTEAPAAPRNDRQFTAQPAPARPATPNWRERYDRSTPVDTTPSETAPAAPRDTSWRNRGADQPAAGGEAAAPPPRTYTPRPAEGASDVPRRVIDGIGGARIYRGDGGNRSGSSNRGGSSASAPPPPSRGGGSVERSSPPPPPPPPPSRNEGSGSRDSGGGKVSRDNKQ